MTFVRGVFLFAIVTLAVGMIGSHMWLQQQFGNSLGPVATVAVAQSTQHHVASKPSARPATRPATPMPVQPSAMPAATAVAPTAAPPPTVSNPPTPRSITAGQGGAAPATGRTHQARQTHHTYQTHHTARPRTALHRHHAAATATATPAASPTAMPSPTTGTVTLANYWVNDTVAKHGHTIALGYVIDNGTGHTLRIVLGASVKSNTALNWASQSVSDPFHDVVATVPPGVTTHVRYFTLPAGLRPGSYDVAWGLRNAVDQERVGLVAAAGALRVLR